MNKWCWREGRLEKRNGHLSNAEFENTNHITRPYKKIESEIQCNGDESESNYFYCMDRCKWCENPHRNYTKDPATQQININACYF